MKKNFISIEVIFNYLQTELQVHYQKSFLLNFRYYLINKPIYHIYLVSSTILNVFKY